MAKEVAIEQKERSGKGGFDDEGGFLVNLGGSLASRSVFEIATGSSCGKSDGEKGWEYNWSDPDIDSDGSKEAEPETSAIDKMEGVQPTESSPEQDGSKNDDTTNDASMEEEDAAKEDGDAIPQNVWLSAREQLAAAEAREATLKCQLEELRATYEANALSVQTGIRPAPPDSASRNDKGSEAQNRQDDGSGADG